jgi:hypothetical protein
MGMESPAGDGACKARSCFIKKFNQCARPWPDILRSRVESSEVVQAVYIEMPNGKFWAFIQGVEMIL